VPNVLAQVLDVAQNSPSTVLTHKQRGAVALPFITRFSLLAGYAGSGKTTVLARIEDETEALSLTTHFLALSGRAAQRIIIDESSMLDIITLWRMLRELRPTRLMLLANTAQLPPIGYGHTFHAFVDWPEV
jgi:exodeoxyribonuclease V alpha subunit